LSLAGSSGAPLPDSVIQDFLSDKVEAVTHSPGYDETTILSPDERLGIVMSSRFSPKTNFAVLGLMPRPYGALVTMGMTMNVYLSAVTAVRAIKKGNVGPALIEIARSQNEPGYLGACLCDPDENWVDHSPMSWNPNGKSVMWPEKLRGSDKGRVQIARLLDYNPSPAIPARQTPDEIGYGVPIVKATPPVKPGPLKGKIAGKHSGWITYESGPGETKSQYENMSDEAGTVYNGYEELSQSADDGMVYEAKLKAEGTQPGEMNLRLVFSPFAGWTPDKLPHLVFGEGKSEGFATYNSKTIRVEDMENN
jgi:hypothetical protein